MWAEKYSELDAVEFVFVALEPDSLTGLKDTIPQLTYPQPLSTLTYPIVFRETDDWRQYVSKYTVTQVPGKGWAAEPYGLGIAIVDPAGNLAAVRGYPGYHYASYEVGAELEWITDTIDGLLRNMTATVSGVVSEQPAGATSPPITGASVAFTPKGGAAAQSVSSGTGGHYQIALSPGHYWLFAAHTDYADYSTYPRTLPVGAQGLQTFDIALRRMIGTAAPDATWPVAWENGHVAEGERSMSLSGLVGKVVVLLLSESAPPGGGG